jgi:beta-glucanase (GH16 family)
MISVVLPDSQLGGIHFRMRNSFRTVIVLTLLAAGGFASVLAAGPADLPGWTLTFDDEFDGNSLDLTKWNPKDPWGRERNQELQAYTTNAFTVADGILRIRAEKPEAQVFYAGKLREYTSGMMNTYEKFSQQYGRFEIRCRVPKGKGMWPAFWLLPDPLSWPPEIDVLEILGHEPDKIYMTVHWQDAGGKLLHHGTPWVGPDFSADFHTYAVEWSPQRIVWFVDGVERFRSEKYIPNKKMYMLVNLAVGGDWPKSPNAKTKFPADLDVKYVRVYQKTW